LANSTRLAASVAASSAETNVLPTTTTIALPPLGGEGRGVG